MEIKGFIGVSLVDWDGKVSSVVFLPGCNMRCPFCYNKRLVLQPSRMPTIPIEKILDYMKKNKGWIDGAVITGGEPTIHEGLPNLCQEIKELDLLVKLDTNGTNPKMVTELTERQLIDYVAIDIKAPFSMKKYSQASGLDATALLPKIEQTAQTLLKGEVESEFRTTLVPTIHKITDVQEICERIRGCRKYVLQNFRSNAETMNPSFQKLSPFSQSEVAGFFRVAKRLIPNTILRK